MNRFFLFCLLIFPAFLTLSCNMKQGVRQSISDINEDIKTLPKDSLDVYCSINIQQLKRVVKTDTNRYDKYLLNNDLFTGWACQVFNDIEHQYRYMLIQDGQLVRQIGYFENGQLDHDFRIKNGKNQGSSRMWRSDGLPYIEEYYNQFGNMDGIQKRWHAGKVLAREALYKNGTLIYDICYDQNGNVTKQTGVKQ